MGGRCGTGPTTADPYSSVSAFVFPRKDSQNLTGCTSLIEAVSYVDPCSVALTKHPSLAAL